MRLYRPVPRLNQVWAIIGAITGVLAVVVAVYTFLADRSLRIKSLSIELLANSALVNRELGKLGPDIRILVNGKEARNFNIITMRVRNTGRQPILESDFSGPIRLLLKGVDAIAFAELADRFPRSLEPVLSVAQNTILINPLLLNPEDSFIIEIGANLNTGKIVEFSVAARIAGIKDAGVSNLMSPTAPPTWNAFVVALIGMTLGLVSSTLATLVVYRRGVERRGFAFDTEESLDEEFEAAKRQARHRDRSPRE